MKHRAIIPAFLALAALADTAEASPGTAAQEFTLPAAGGATFRGRFRMADHLRRKPIVVLFWATWCGPCLQELPIYQALYQRYGGRLTVVGISMDGPDTVSEAGATARRLGITFPVVTDLETQVVSVYNPRRAAPFSVWIDRGGIITREREGFSMSEVANVNAGIAQLVGPAPGAPIAPPPAPPPAPPGAPAPLRPATPLPAPVGPAPVPPSTVPPAPSARPPAVVPPPATPPAPH